MAVGTFIKGVVGRVLPAPRVGDGGEQASRISGYGDNYVLSLIQSKHLLADEGQYFVSTNPTPGTAVTYGTATTPTSFSDTGALFVIKNNDVAGGKRLYVDYIKLLEVTTGITAMTSFEYAIKVDNVTRTPTANFTTIVPVNPNMDSSVGPIGQLFAFSAGIATVPAASGSARIVGRGRLGAGISILGDEYVLSFGAPDVGAMSGITTAVRAAACARFIAGTAPVVLGPQQWMVFNAWMPATATAAHTFEWEIGWWER